MSLWNWLGRPQHESFADFAKRATWNETASTEGVTEPSLAGYIDMASADLAWETRKLAVKAEFLTAYILWELVAHSRVLVWLTKVIAVLTLVLGILTAVLAGLTGLLVYRGG